MVNYYCCISRRRENKKKSQEKAKVKLSAGSETKVSLSKISICFAPQTEVKTHVKCWVRVSHAIFNVSMKLLMSTN